jgi:hypothetical protein
MKNEEAEISIIRTRKRSAQGLKTSLVAVIAVLFCYLAENSRSAEILDPSYNGKALSEWLLELHRRPAPEEFPEEFQKRLLDPEQFEKIYEKKKFRDQGAIRQIGTNGLPTLLALLGVTEQNIKATLSRLKSSELHGDWWNEAARVEDVRNLAFEGFEVLGTNAAPAIPELTKMLRNSDALFEAARALTRVGPSGFSALTNALTDPNGSVRGAVIWWLREADPIYSQVVERLLIERLRDPDPGNQHNAAQFLTGKDPSAIPELIKMLDDDKNYFAVSGAAEGLSKFGPAAKAAVPKLLAIYTNSVASQDRATADVWEVSVMDALKAIDSEAAAKAEALLVKSGALNAARFGYTTTLLSNGMELIVGGYIHTEVGSFSNRYLASAELNDPATGKWVETGELSMPRNSHTATLLADGRVLVAGGTDGKGHALASCEIYDPTIGKWNLTGSLNKARFYHMAGLQPDGRVMIAQGHTGQNPLDDSEFYDPATEKWALGPSITNLHPVVRQGHTATLLRNGQVLIVGGFWSTTAELYDPAKGTWAYTPAPVFEAGGLVYTATLLRTGHVLVTGDRGNPKTYDPEIAEWKDTAAMVTKRFGGTATLLTNGNVLVAGGQDNREHALASAEQYEPATTRWSKAAPMHTARFSHTATVLRSGLVLVAGGEVPDRDVLATAELYNPATGKWTETGKLKTPRSGHIATLLPGGKVLVVGGSDGGGPTASCELYEPSTGKWIPTGSLNVACSDNSATLLPNGNVLLAGSFHNPGGSCSRVEIYDAKSAKWIQARSLTAPRNSHTATALPDGTVLFVGGEVVNRWEIYDVSKK